MRPVGSVAFRPASLVSAAQAWWLTNGRLITPQGIIDGAVGIAPGRIAAIQRRAPRVARTINLRGAYEFRGHALSRMLKKAFQGDSGDETT